MALGNMDIGVNTANLAGIAVVVFVAAVNIRGVHSARACKHLHRRQGVSLAALILLGFTVGRNAGAFAANFGATGASSGAMPVGTRCIRCRLVRRGPLRWSAPSWCSAVVQVGSLFSCDAWNNVTFTAGEIKHPRRNVPLSLGLGVGFVVITYFLASTAYMMVLPLRGDPHGATVFARGIQYASEDRIGAAVLQQIFPHFGGFLMAAAIMVSTFGCANGMTLAGARVSYAMAQDGLFFKSVGKLHPRHRTPAAGLIVQAVWLRYFAYPDPIANCSTTLSSRRLVFYILTIAGLFVLRVKQPDAPRPYKAVGYPFLRRYISSWLRYLRGAAALQAAIHLAWVDPGAAGRSGVFSLVAEGGSELRSSAVRGFNAVQDSDGRCEDPDT